MSRTGFLADETGAVAVMAVLLMCVVMAMGAIAVDASRFYVVKRRQQMVTDLAAAAAAANLDNPRAAALANLAANGLPAATLLSLEIGTYAPDPATPANQRFVAGAGAGNNAVRVTLQSLAPSFLAGALGPLVAAAPLISTRSVAANQNTAAFALGSTLATLDGGLANALLSELVGTEISLSVLDYQSLATADVDLFGTAKALSARMGGGSPTLSVLAAQPVRLSDLVAAMADAGGAAGLPSASVAAMRNLASAASASRGTTTLGALVDYSVYGDLAVSAPAPVSAALPVLPLVTAAARLASGDTGEIQAALGATVPGLLSASVKIAIGAPAIGSTYAGVGPVGTTLHTAQVRLLLTAQVQGVGGLAALSLPLYAEIAPATSRIATLACHGGSPVDPPVTLGITPGIANAWIGAVSDQDLTDWHAEPNPGPATLANLGAVAVAGRAQASVGNLSESLVPFTLADVVGNDGKTVTTTDYTSSLLSRLFGSLQLTATVAGLQIAVPQTATAAVGQTLRSALQPVDTELSNTLAMLGLTLGDATSWVGGVRCGSGSLVN